MNIPIPEDIRQMAQQIKDVAQLTGTFDIALLFNLYQVGYTHGGIAALKQLKEEIAK